MGEEPGGGVLGEVRTGKGGLSVRIRGWGGNGG